MSIEYKILWVDDSPQWVESIQDSIKIHLDEKGYQPNFILKEDGDNLTNDIQLTDIDLIIIDYHLPNVNGNELISRIRETECLTEIVFYSQDVAPQDVIDHPPDGIYYCARDEAEDYIMRVIDVTTKKAQDLTLIRGFIIAEAIDIENILEEYMAIVFEEKSELFSDKVINAKPPVYDSYKKYRFVKRIVDDIIENSKEDVERLSELKEIEKTMKKLTTEVFEQRNILGHSKKIIKNDNSITLEGINKQTKEIVFDQKWLSLTRKNILKHKENLIKLKNYL